MIFIMCKDVIEISKNMRIKVEFLSLGFKGFEAFCNVCYEYGDFFQGELLLFWKHNTFAPCTLSKIESILNQLKAE